MSVEAYLVAASQWGVPASALSWSSSISMVSSSLSIFRTSDPGHRQSGCQLVASGWQKQPMRRIGARTVFVLLVFHASGFGAARSSSRPGGPDAGDFDRHFQTVFGADCCCVCEV